MGSSRRQGIFRKKKKIVKPPMQVPPSFISGYRDSILYQDSVEGKAVLIRHLVVQKGVVHNFLFYVKKFINDTGKVGTVMIWIDDGETLRRYPDTIKANYTPLDVSIEVEVGDRITVFIKLPDPKVEERNGEEVQGEPAYMEDIWATFCMTPKKSREGVEYKVVTEVPVTEPEPDLMVLESPEVELSATPLPIEE